MNILVTGACGYIGSHFAQKLHSARRHRVFVLDDLSSGFADSIPPDAELLVCGLENTEKTRRFVEANRIEAVFHFAGKISVPESLQNPAKYYLANTVNTCQLARIAAEASVKFFIFSSTAAVYSQPKDDALIGEDAPTVPVTPYGASKLMSERIIADICNAGGMKFALLRYFNVAGADMESRIGSRNKNAQHLIKMCCDVALGHREFLEIFGNQYPTKDGTGVRDYIHVADLAQAHLDVFDYLSEGGESDVFNIGYGRGYSVLEVLQTLEKIVGARIPAKIRPPRAGDCAQIVADNRKILAKTAWRPKHDSLERILADTFAWERIKR